MRGRSVDNSAEQGYNGDEKAHTHEERGVINGREKETGNGEGDRGEGSQIYGEFGRETVNGIRISQDDDYLKPLEIDSDRGLDNDPRWGSEDYTEAEVNSVTEKTQKALAEYGIEGHVVSSEVWGDKYNPKKNAYTYKGKVYLRNGLKPVLKTESGYVEVDLDAFAKGMSVHEGSHVMRQTEYIPYVNFLKKLPGMLNAENSELIAELEKVSEEHGIDMSIFGEMHNLDSLKPGKANKIIRAFDELNARIYGTRALDETLADAYFEQFFADEDTYRKYLAEMDKIHEGYKAKNKPKREPYNVLNNDNPVVIKRKAEQAGLEGKIKKATGFGEYGVKAVADVMKKTGASIEDVKSLYEGAYLFGATNGDGKTAGFQNDTQIQMYEAGKKDWIMKQGQQDEGNLQEASGRNVGENSVEQNKASGVSAEGREYTNIGENNNETEEIHIRRGGERVDGTHTTGKIRGVENGTGRNQSRGTQNRSADSDAASLTLGEKVSVASLGIGKGTRNASIRLVTGGETEATRTAKAVAKERGLRLVLFAGDNLTLTAKNGEVISARAYISGDRVFVRADHPDFTADQLMRHEAGHDMIEKGEINLDAVRDRIGKEKVEKVSELYSNAYEGSNMSAEEIFEEIVCDSLGDMNIFSETLAESETASFLEETSSAVGATKTEPQQGRAPPVGARFSREVSLDMDESERYEVLKDKKIQPQSIEVDGIVDIEYLERNIKSIIEKPLIKKLNELGYIKKYRADKINIEFELTNRGIRKSLHSQVSDYGGNFGDFAKVILNLQKLLDNSVVLEIHSDKAKGSPRENRNLKKTYVLFASFLDGEYIKPVQFEIKEYTDNNNRLYLAVALTKIETGVVGNTVLEKNQAATNLIPISTVSISDLFAKINPSDKNFLKYIPDQFLDKNQLEAKKEALYAEKEKYNREESPAEKGGKTSIEVKPENTTSEESSLVSEVQDSVRTTVREELDRMGREYGWIPKGEKAVREVKLPKKTEKDKRVSQTVRTILEAKATPDAAIPRIEKMVEDGVFSYDAYTDKQAIADAEASIRESGWEEGLRDWFDSVKNGKVSKEITAKGWAFYNNAANIAETTTSETEKASATRTCIEILNAMVAHQRSAAQALQATRILKKLSPETQLYGVSKSVATLQEELKNRYGKKAPDLKIDETLAEDFLKAKTQEERTEIEKKIYQDIGSQIPSRFIDRWNAWRYLAMLGNVRTHGRNILGNAGFAPVVGVKNLTATAIESAIYRVSGKRTARTKAFVGVGKADRDLLAAAWDDYANVADMVSNGGKYSDLAMANQHIEEGRRIFKTKPLEWARKGNGKLLEMEDVWFSKPHYAHALASYCKANKITAEQLKRGKALGAAREYAIKEAQKATYKDTNAFSQLVSGFGKSPNSNGVAKAARVVADGIMPFRKTPANILVRGVEYSPLGLLKSLSWDIYRVSKGEITSAEAIDNISAGLTGTGLLALGMWLAAEGLIRGHGEDDEEEKEFNEMMGHQAYSLELPNGTSVTLDWLAPEALPFFVGVNLWEATQGKDEEVTLSTLLQASSRITEPMLEMSCLQGVNDLIEGLGYASSNDTSGVMALLSSAATSYLTQGLPTIFGQAERTGEEKRMTTYTEKNAFLTNDMQYTLGKVSAKIPGWDYNQIPYIDAWGRKEASGTALKRGLNNFLNPAYTSTVETSDMEKELLRLYEETGEDKVFPERAGKYFTVDGKRKDLTAEEYVRYATLKGQKSYELVSALVQSKEYKALDDGEKVKAVDEAYSFADQKAKQAVSNYKPDAWVSSAESLGSNVEDYITFRANVSSVRDANGGKIKKPEVVDIILDMGLDDDDTWALYLSNYDSKTDVEAHKLGINVDDYINFSAGVASIKPDYRRGKVVTGSRERKVRDFAKSLGLSNKDFYYLMGTEFSSYKKKPQYIRYFGR